MDQRFLARLASLVQGEVTNHAYCRTCHSETLSAPKELQEGGSLAAVMCFNEKREVLRCYPLTCQVLGCETLRVPFRKVQNSDPDLNGFKCAD